MKQIRTGLALTAALLSATNLVCREAKALPRPLPNFTLAAWDDDEEGIETAHQSKVAKIALPENAFRSKNKKDNAKFADALGQITKPNGREIGPVEVLIWEKGADVKTEVVKNLKMADYKYTAQDPVESEGNKITFFVAVRENKEKDSDDKDGDTKSGKTTLVGMWINRDGNLVLAWTTATPTKAKSDKSDTTEPAVTEDKAEAKTEDGAEKTDEDAKPAKKHAQRESDEEAKPSKASTKTTSQKADSAEAGDAIELRSDAASYQLNVMGRKRPALPTFPTLAVKPNLVRGYVRDMKGHPIKGAVIGVRSTAVGGAYTGASVRSDAKGYYEIQAPWGAAEFSIAGYQTDYGDLIGAFGLHPEDGQKEGFATVNGMVKNWVLLPYGVGDRAKAQDDPKYCGNYYGGTVCFFYHTDANSGLNNALPSNSEIEITLTPTGPCIDGSKARTIVLHKATDDAFSHTFYLNNIPVAPYKIKARMAGVGALRLRETGPDMGKPFGITPKDAKGEAELLLKVYNSDPEMVTASHGHWHPLQIDLERP